MDIHLAFDYAGYDIKEVALNFFDLCENLVHLEYVETPYDDSEGDNGPALKTFLLKPELINIVYFEFEDGGIIRIEADGDEIQITIPAFLPQIHTQQSTVAFERFRDLMNA